ncbi:MAG: hypothetical protein ABSA26_11410 [Thermoguttaceae bacterium]|jgi:hypothetical protein
MRSGRSEPIYNLLGAMIIFHAAVQFITLSLSILRIRLDFPFPQLIVLLSLAAGYGFWRSGKNQQEFSGEQTKSSVWPPDMTVLSAGLVYFLLCVVGYFANETSFDGNLYHLPSICFWNMKGYICWINDDIPFSIYMNGFPKAVELAAFVITHAFHSDAVANAINMLFYPLGAVGLAYLASVLGASRPLSWTAGAVWLLIPVNIFQAPTLYVDSSYASCIVAFIAAAVYAFRNYRPSSFRENLRPLLIYGAAAGLVIGGKSTGIMIVSLGFITIAFCFIYCWAKERAAGFFKAVIFPLLFMGAVAIAVGGYWSLRNYLMKGSPMFPAGLYISDHCIFPGKRINEIVYFESDTAPQLQGRPVYERILKTWLQQWGWTKDFFWCDTRIGGLGYFWPIACLPAIPGFFVYTIFKRNWKTLKILLLILTIAGGAFLLQPMNWWTRHTVWIYAIGLPSFAALISVFYAAPERSAFDNAADSHGNESPFSRRGSLCSLTFSGAIKLWAATSFLILIAEGWVCCFWACTWVQFPSPETIINSSKARFAPRENILWPKLRGTILYEIISNDDDLAITKVDVHCGTNYALILSGLTTPNGKRRIVPISIHPGKEDIDRLVADGVRYLIWDSTYPLPEVLKQYDFPMEKAEVFYVFKLSTGGKSATQENGDKSK